MKPVRQVAAFLLLLGLTACGQSVSGNSSYVTVGNVWSDADALPKAEAHCSTYGKTARFKYIDKYRATFDCVQS